ncbi:hypothetical protein D3C81_1088990 [compost metagenome]
MWQAWQVEVARIQNLQLTERLQKALDRGGHGAAINAERSDMTEIAREDGQVADDGVLKQHGVPGGEALLIVVRDVLPSPAFE